MTEEAKKDVVTKQELGTPESSTEVNASQPLSEPKEGSKEFNFRRLEQEKLDAERRYREQEALNKELLGALRGNLQPSKPIPAEEVLPELAPDDIPEWKHVKSYAKKIAEQQFQELMAKREKERLPHVVKEKFQDFDKIVTPERIQTLEKENPELADAFTRATDPFTATYSYFKALYRETPKQDPIAMEEAQKILENSKKPLSSNAVGTTGALKNATAFAKKDKDALYREMMSAAARAS